MQVLLNNFVKKNSTKSKLNILEKNRGDLLGLLESLWGNFVNFRPKVKGDIAFWNVFVLLELI
jgi:hypothetical protein